MSGRPRDNWIVPGDRVTAYRGHALTITAGALGFQDPMRGVVIELQDRWGRDGAMCALVLLDGDGGVGLWQCSDLSPEEPA